MAFGSSILRAVYFLYILYSHMCGGFLGFVQILYKYMYSKKKPGIYLPFLGGLGCTFSLFRDIDLCWNTG